MFQSLTAAVCVICLHYRRVCPSEGCHGEKETDSKGRTRLALRDPLVYPLQSGVCARRQPETRRKFPLSPPANVQMKSFVIMAVTTFIYYLLIYVLLMQDNADPVLLGDHDVALASIEKVVVGK